MPVDHRLHAIGLVVGAAGWREQRHAATRAGQGRKLGGRRRGLLPIGILLAVMILVSAATYYLLNWLPQLIADAGFTPSQGALVSAMPALVGMVAGLLWGLAANRFGPARLAAISAVGLGCAMIVFGLTPPVLGLLLLSSGLIGVCAGGCAGLFYATMAATLPPLVRVTGIGLVIGLGRVFSVAGPALAGLLFSAGLTRAGVTLIFAGAPILAGVLLFVSSRPRPQPLEGRT